MATLEPTDETFVPALRVLGHLRDRGDLLISLSPPFSISIEIERTVLDPHLRQTNVSEADIRAVAGEASTMLHALLEGEVEDYLEYRLQSADPEERSDTETALRRRVAQVQEQLNDDRLRRRYALKKTSKAPAFSAISWDIKSKIADGAMPDLEAFPSTQLAGFPTRRASTMLLGPCWGDCLIRPRSTSRWMRFAMSSGFYRPSRDI